MRNRIEMRTVAAIAAMIVTSTMTVGQAHAATANVTVPINLAVTAPTCTVANSNASVALPSSSSPNMTLAQYMSANSITTAGVANSNWATSSAFNQTATITCSSPATILSFVVQPGPSATLNGAATGQEVFVDAATPPVKAGNGNLLMNFEQVSVNGTAAPFAYMVTANGNIQSYTTAFNTSGASNTATVVWRPALYPTVPATALGNPTGGVFTGSAQIVVTY